MIYYPLSAAGRRLLVLDSRRLIIIISSYAHTLLRKILRQADFPISRFFWVALRSAVARSSAVQFTIPVRSRLWV
jgi:hypothetical protein